MDGKTSIGYTVKVGDLVHFVDCEDVQYDTLGLIVGLYPNYGAEAEYWPQPGVFKVVWYDDDCSTEDFDEEDLRVVSEGWRFSNAVSIC